jgi:hypothetical protein
VRARHHTVVSLRPLNLSVSIPIVILPLIMPTAIIDILLLDHLFDDFCARMTLTSLLFLYIFNRSTSLVLFPVSDCLLLQPSMFYMGLHSPLIYNSPLRPIIMLTTVSHRPRLRLQCWQQVRRAGDRARDPVLPMWQDLFRPRQLRRAGCHARWCAGLCKWHRIGIGIM